MHQLMLSCLGPTVFREPRNFEPSQAEVSEQLFQFSVINGRLWPSRGIWSILQRWAAEFRELARGIWQNFPRKNVGPNRVVCIYCVHAVLYLHCLSSI